MINWLKFLFHNHKWKIIKQEDKNRKIEYVDGSTKERTFTKYHSQCEICGKLKAENF